MILISEALKCPDDAELIFEDNALEILFSDKILIKISSGNRKPSSLLENPSSPFSNSAKLTSARVLV